MQLGWRHTSEGGNRWSPLFSFHFSRIVILDALGISSTKRESWKSFNIASGVSDVSFLIWNAVIKLRRVFFFRVYTFNQTIDNSPAFPLSFLSRWVGEFRSFYDYNDKKLWLFLVMSILLWCMVDDARVRSFSISSMVIKISDDRCENHWFLILIRAVWAKRLE